MVMVTFGEEKLSKIAEKMDMEIKRSSMPIPLKPRDRNHDRTEQKNNFTRLETNCKGLLKSTIEAVQDYKEVESNHNLCLAFEAKISELLGGIRQHLNEMKSIADDMITAQSVKGYSPKIVDDAKSCRLTVEGIHGALRKLQMDYHRLLNSKQREDLLSLSTSPFENGSRRRRKTDGLGGIAAGTTENLLYSKQILYETVQRSTLTIEQLNQSSQVIQNNQEELKDQSTAVSMSSKLLRKYGRREWTDKILICLALCFFFACVVFVIQRRLF